MNTKIHRSNNQALWHFRLKRLLLSNIQKTNPYRPALRRIFLCPKNNSEIGAKKVGEAKVFERETARLFPRVSPETKIQCDLTPRADVFCAHRAPPPWTSPGGREIGERPGTNPDDREGPLAPRQKSSVSTTSEKDGKYRRKAVSWRRTTHKGKCSGVKQRKVIDS